MTDPQVHPIVASIVANLAGSQTEIAQRAGLSQSYFCQIATGKRVPPLATIERLAKVAGLELRLVKLIKAKGAKP